MAKIMYAKPALLDPPSYNVDDRTYLLWIKRSPEQMTSTDLGKAYRSSHIACYKKTKNLTWNLIFQPLKIRSESTTLHPPMISDAETVKRFIENNGSYAYGHCSIPAGIYWGTWRKDEFARHTQALALSDEGQMNNRIHLSTTSTIYTFKQYEIDASNGILKPLKPAISEVTAKGDCFIHESINKNWNHRDSMGCMNLLKDTSDIKRMSDWDVFMSWFDKYDAVNDGPIAIVVLAAEGNYEKGFPRELGRNFVADERAKFKANKDK